MMMEGIKKGREEKRKIEEELLNDKEMKNEKMKRRK